MTSLSRQLLPALSTVHTPNAEIGRRTGEALQAALRDGLPPESLTLRCELLQRQSTGPSLG